MNFDAIELRNACGRFVTGVTVITTSGEGIAPFGMTVNSFSSLSLDPPLVLWSLQNNSECLEAFEAVDKYCVNILSEKQQDLSNTYAKKGNHDLLEEHYYLGDSGCPVLKGSLVSLECRIEQRYPGGDHIILVGRVLELTNSNDEKPLVFNQGGYSQLV